MRHIINPTGRMNLIPKVNYSKKAPSFPTYNFAQLEAPKNIFKKTMGIGVSDYGIPPIKLLRPVPDLNSSQPVTMMKINFNIPKPLPTITEPSSKLPLDIASKHPVIPSSTITLEDISLIPSMQPISNAFKPLEIQKLPQNEERDEEKIPTESLDPQVSQMATPPEEPKIHPPTVEALPSIPEEQSLSAEPPLEQDKANKENGSLTQGEQTPQQKASNLLTGVNVTGISSSKKLQPHAEVRWYQPSSIVKFINSSLHLGQLIHFIRDLFNSNNKHR